VFLAISSNAYANTVVTYDLTTGTEFADGSAGNLGNHFVFDTPVSEVDALEVWAYSDAGSGNPSFEAAQVVPVTDLGLGVCNSQEDRIRPDNSLIECEDRVPAVTSVDNRFEQDWLLFIIPNLSGNVWESIILDSDGSQDKDISYWVGTVTQAPTSFDFADFSSFNHVDIDSAGPLSIDLTGVPAGNALLIGASLINTDGAPDRVFVSSITTVVPLPPAFLMFGSALLALIGNRWSRA